jgi:hypothetical protein
VSHSKAPRQAVHRTNEVSSIGGSLYLKNGEDCFGLNNNEIIDLVEWRIVHIVVQQHVHLVGQFSVMGSDEAVADSHPLGQVVSQKTSHEHLVPGADARGVRFHHLPYLRGAGLEFSGNKRKEVVQNHFPLLPTFSLKIDRVECKTGFA